jgi:hypothetical protein
MRLTASPIIAWSSISMTRIFEEAEVSAGAFIMQEIV